MISILNDLKAPTCREADARMTREGGGMRKLVILHKPSLALALLLIGSSYTPTAARQVATNSKVAVDPAQRPKFRAMIDAINQRARELGLISINEDEDQEAFVRRRRDAQLREDFEKLCSIGTERLVLLSSAPSLDLKSLSDATADLKTRANRIKYGIPILQVADKGEGIRYEEYPNCLATMLPELTRLVNSFLGSPIFRFSSPNDAELRLKASRDLDAIIKLSDTVNKIAKRSVKTSASR
jgi:hypothetical protein